MNEVRLTGGCQCGAVRYAVHEAPFHVGFCHCRMCQKAAGAPLFAVFTVKMPSLEWTRGTAGVFKSSSRMERGFCRDCGTPLFSNWITGDVIHPAIATLDDPSSVRPQFQEGIESRLPWTTRISALRPTTTSEIFRGYEGLLAEIKATNHQHPDHDTEAWPAEGRES